jgi:hypothetical protein
MYRCIYVIHMGVKSSMQRRMDNGEDKGSVGKEGIGAKKQGLQSREPPVMGYEMHSCCCIATTILAPIKLGA